MLIEKHLMADNMVFCILKGVRDVRKALYFEILIYYFTWVSEQVVLIKISFVMQNVFSC